MPRGTPNILAHSADVVALVAATRRRFRFTDSSALSLALDAKSTKGRAIRKRRFGTRCADREQTARAWAVLALHAARGFSAAVAQDRARALSLALDNDGPPNRRCYQNAPEELAVLKQPSLKLLEEKPSFLTQPMPSVPSVYPLRPTAHGHTHTSGKILPGCNYSGSVLPFQVDRWAMFSTVLAPP